MPRMGGYYPTDHKVTHEKDGRDEVSIASLAGTPAALTTHAANANAHHTPTKELFVPVTQGTLITYMSFFPVCRLAGAGEVARMAFIVPSNFSAIVSASVIIIAKATKTEAMYYTYAWYSAIGGAYNVGYGENESTTYNVVANKIYAIDIAGLLANLAASDCVGLELDEGQAGDNLDVVGVYFKYS